MQIDTGSGRGVWGVNKNHQIWMLKRNRRSWRRIDGSLTYVSCGVGGVWGVNRYRQIFYRLGKFIS